MKLFNIRTEIFEILPLPYMNSIRMPGWPGSGHKDSNLSRNDINVKLLEQLSALGDRLTKMEKKLSVVDNVTAMHPTVCSDSGVVPPSC